MHTSIGTTPRVLATAWMLLWIGAAALLMARTMASGGDSVPSVQDAAQEPEEVATISPGVTARVVSAEISASELVLTIEVLGRDDLGGRVAFRGPAFVTDADGQRYMERGGSVTGRQLSLRFPGAGVVAPGPGNVKVTGIGLTHDAYGGAGIVDATYLGDALLVADVPHSPELLRQEISASGPLGPGTVVVQELVTDGSLAVVRGSLEGFTREQVQSLDLRGTTLMLADGEQLTMTTGSHGDGNRRFEFTFQLPEQHAPIARLVLALGVAPIPESIARTLSAETAESLRALEQANGATSAIELAP